jgi:hypothetical protein
LDEPTVDREGVIVEVDAEGIEFPSEPTKLGWILFLLLLFATSLLMTSPPPLTPLKPV